MMSQSLNITDLIFQKYTLYDITVIEYNKFNILITDSLMTSDSLNITDLLFKK